MRLQLQTYLHSATAAAVVQSRLYANLVECIISRQFMCDNKFPVVLSPPLLAPDPGDATDVDDRRLGVRRQKQSGFIFPDTVRSDEYTTG